MPATHHTPDTTLMTRPTNVKAQPGAGTPCAPTHSGAAAAATPTTQTGTDYFASLSLAHQMMWRILGVFIYICHFLYGVVCYIANVTTPALAAHARSHNEEHPGLHPMMLIPRRTKAAVASKCPPNVGQDTSTSSQPSQTPSSGAHTSADEEENEATAAAERKPLSRLPSMLKKLGAPVRMVSTINARRINMRGNGTTQGRKKGSGDGTGDSDAPSFPRRLSFNSVQRIIPAVGRRRAMSDAISPAKPANSVSTNDRPRAASLPTTLPSTEMRPTLRRVMSTHIPVRDDRSGPSMCVQPPIPPRNIRMPSRTRSDSLVTQSSTSSSSRGTSSDMMHTSIEEVAEDSSDTDDSDTADDSDTGGPAMVASTEDRSHQSGALGNLRRRLERRMTQRARRVVA